MFLAVGVLLHPVLSVAELESVFVYISIYSYASICVPSKTLRLHRHPQIQSHIIGYILVFFLSISVLPSLTWRKWLHLASIYFINSPLYFHFPMWMLSSHISGFPPPECGCFKWPPSWALPICLRAECS